MEVSGYLHASAALTREMSFGIDIFYLEEMNINDHDMSLCLSKHHAMRTYWGSGGIASPHIL
jgi:hypothetical protein